MPTADALRARRRRAVAQRREERRREKELELSDEQRMAREACLDSLRFLINHVLVPFDFGPDFKLSNWHQDRIEELGDSIKKRQPRRLDLWYRGGFKSCIISRYGNIYRLLLRPERPILLRHGDKEKASGIVCAAKKHFTHNQIFRALFPEYCPNSQRWGRGDSFTLPNRKNPVPEPSFLGVGIDANLVGGHWDHISDDDIENESNVATPDLRQRLIRKWEDTPSLLNSPPMEPGTWNGVGTPWHADGLWVHIRNRFGEDQPHVPEARRVPVSFHPACASGEVRSLVPEVFKDEDLEAKLFEEGPYKFNANYRLTPVDPSDAVFREEWVKWHPAPDPAERKDYLESGEVKRCLAIDLADSDTGDMVAWALIDIDPDGRWYARGFREDRIDTLLLIREVQNLFRRYAIDRIVIDSLGSQNYFQKWLKRENESEGLWMSITPVRSNPGNRTKHQRILAFQTRVARGDFIVCEGAPGYNQFRHAATNYPHVAHDDLLDALALLEIVEPLGTSYAEVKEEQTQIGWWREKHKAAKRKQADVFVPKRRAAWRP